MLEENKFSYRALLHGKDAKWYFARGLDDITAAGSYEVRLFHNDMESLGITTADCDKEHYVVAHLFVSESAATGRQQALRVVGQTLLLTICATNAVKAFTRTCETTPKGASWGSWVDLGAASTTDIQDGSITAQKLSSDIRPNAVSPLRPLFIAAGAEYNDTGVDISKTAPWGETVTHKAGHYYLNGLGNITEEQMVKIYNAGPFWLSESASGVLSGSSIRTNLPPLDHGLYRFKSFDMTYSFNDELPEVIVLVDPLASNDKAKVISVKSINGCFVFANKLKRVYGTIDIKEAKGWTAIYGTSLQHLYLSNMSSTLRFNECVSLGKESILFMINNATPHEPISIVLHPNAYARLADDADVVAALEAQPLVSLVSA